MRHRFFTPFIVGAINFGCERSWLLAYPRKMLTAIADGYVFAGCNLAGAIIVYFFLYESSGTCSESRSWRELAC